LVLVASELLGQHTRHRKQHVTARVLQDIIIMLPNQAIASTLPEYCRTRAVVDGRGVPWFPYGTICTVSCQGSCSIGHVKLRGGLQVSGRHLLVKSWLQWLKPSSPVADNLSHNGRLSQSELQSELHHVTLPSIWFMLGCKCLVPGTQIIWARYNDLFMDVYRRTSNSAAAPQI
jgi:hypothetical protein